MFSRGQCGLEVNESDSDFFLSFSTGMPPEIQKLHFTALKEEATPTIGFFFSGCVVFSRMFTIIYLFVLFIC